MDAADIAVTAGRQVPERCLDQLFLEARTHNEWLPEPVPENLLRDIYRLARMGPTSANACPGRFVFVTSKEARDRLVPLLSPKNVAKVLAAPVTAIIAWDTEFYEEMPKLMPYLDGRAAFTGKPALIEETGFRNSSLQGAYLMIAARALGLDCGPMSGFDKAKLNAEFFPDGRWTVNFICNLGYGDKTKLHPRNPRLDFSEACRVI